MVTPGNRSHIITPAEYRKSAGGKPPGLWYFGEVRYFDVAVQHR
jgi:hypothetical protein